MDIQIRTFFLIYEPWIYQLEHLLVPHSTRKTHKNIIEIGPYGSPWVHIERIRSHRPYKGFKIPKIDLVCNIRLNMSLYVGLGILGWSQKISEEVFGQISMFFLKFDPGAQMKSRGVPYGPIPTGFFFCLGVQRVNLIN